MSQRFIEQRDFYVHQLCIVFYIFYFVLVNSVKRSFDGVLALLTVLIFEIDTLLVIHAFFQHMC